MLVLDFYPVVSKVCPVIVHLGSDDLTHVINNTVGGVLSLSLSSKLKVQSTQIFDNIDTNLFLVFEVRYQQDSAARFSSGFCSCSFLVFLWSLRQVRCSPGWSQTFCVSKSHLELLILLPLLPTHWGCRLHHHTPLF